MVDGAYGFKKLKQKILEERGLDVSQYKENYLKRRFGIRVRANDADSYYNYMNILDSEPQEYVKLIDTLDVNVTEFFRNPEVFEVLGTQILPQLIANKLDQGRNTIRIWSAGCSDGKETYSIAMLLHEILGWRIRDFDILIKGTDYDPSVLNKARNGVYETYGLIDIEEQVPPNYLKEYFICEGDTYTIKPEVKELTAFRHHDLISGRKFTGFDMILCRNVTIYFSRELQDKLYMDFYSALNNHGYLVMGKTETLVGNSRELFEIVDNRERIYQKIEE
jgi:chemotaxis protein methyltransferase CheR